MAGAVKIEKLRRVFFVRRLKGKETLVKCGLCQAGDGSILIVVFHQDMLEINVTAGLRSYLVTVILCTVKRREKNGIKDIIALVVCLSYRDFF